MNVIPDAIDLDRYIQAPSDLKVKVRAASSYLAELKASFARHEAGHRDPIMSSTKLRDVIEFRPGEITVWAGFNGHRKSTFAGQVALDLMAQDQRTLIASFEMRPVDTIKRMARQALVTRSPDAYEIEDFARWTENRGWVFDHVGEITPERCLAVCRYFVEELQGKHVFIDSMMMVVASEDHLDGQKRFVTSLVRFAIETGAHVHLIAHCKKPQGAASEGRAPSKYDIKGTSAVSDQASNVITLWSDKTGQADSGYFLATVEKQRNGSWEGRISLWFDAPSMRFTDSNQFAVKAYEGLTR